MMDANKPGVSYGISTQYTPEVLEKPVSTGGKLKELFIGVPKDTNYLERRVPLTPNAVSVLVAHGHRVVVESNAGADSNFFDNEYSEAGADIAHDKESIYKTDIIVKVGPPRLEEIEWMHTDQMLIAPIQLPTLEIEVIKALMKKRITALAFEYIKDEVGSYPFVRSMSEIAGSTAVLIASEYLSHLFDGQGILLGGITGVAPTSVVILGAGVVGEFAVRAALGLGADVKLFDDNIYKILRLQESIGRRLYNSVIDPVSLRAALKTADVVIGAIHSESGRAPIIVTEEMVAEMKHNSVIVDVSMDQGGIFDTSELTTHDNPTFKKYGVTHYCVPNIPSRVSRTASYSLSNILQTMIIKASKMGGLQKLLHSMEGVRQGAYIYKGCLTNEHLGEKFGLTARNIDLLFALES